MAAGGHHRVVRKLAGTIRAIVVLGIFSAVIGYAAWGYTIRHFGSAGATNFIYLVPPVAMLLALVMTGEIPNALTLVGGSLAIAGVVIVNTTRKPVASPSSG
jgi:drug/metabolite transporter (DMT)-like permease